MKQALALFIAIVILATLLPFAYANVSPQERLQLQQTITTVVEKANAQDFTSLEQLISLNARSGLLAEIEDEFAAKNVNFKITTRSFKELENNQVRVSAQYSYTAAGESGSGIGAFFVFEKAEQGYLLVDTNFHKMTHMRYALKHIFVDVPIEWLGFKSTKIGIGSALLIAVIAFALFIGIIIFIICLLRKAFQKQ